MGDYSEFRRETELARQWEKPMRRFYVEIPGLDRVPTLCLVRGWDDKDKRYFLKQLRGIKDKLSVWVEVLEEEVY